ncbi:hypothetical protein J6590_044771 [Homalodisca vitripennis]|nr:hypothetical protein J6590_105340 [Homalodisca vitripennis]KAG8287150.1 hypothetical protein J6590_044771 [Homalodisca vitripennis]
MENGSVPELSLGFGLAQWLEASRPTQQIEDGGLWRIICQGLTPRVGLAFVTRRCGVRDLFFCDNSPSRE